MTDDEWISFFKAGVVAPDMPAEVVRAFFHHLVDLGVFERGDGESWHLTGADIFEVPNSEILVRRLDALTSKGKALFMPYFLYPPRDLPDILSLKTGAKSAAQHINTPASDLSNLQIVKKIGRQLEPFIELEKYFLDCVEGPNTNKADARILFGYLLEKNREKGQPRAWEQLSRRRHQ